MRLARSIQDEVSRIRVLASSLPFLPPEQQRSVLAEIADEILIIQNADVILPTLASLLPKSLLSPLLTKIAKVGLSIDVPREFLPCLPKELLFKQLSAARAKKRVEDRIQALIDIFPYIPLEDREKIGTK